MELSQHILQNEWDTHNDVLLAVIADSFTLDL
jgi:hypothetical protein